MNPPSALDLLTRLAEPPASTPDALAPPAEPSPWVTFLNHSAPAARADWTPAEPPSLDGIDEIVLNVETDGLDWARGHRPIGITVGTLDGQLQRFLPFRFAGGNLDEATVKRWAERELRGKNILNARTGFDVHMLREWGIDLEAQGNTVADVQLWAALIDDHRKRFALDVLMEDYCGEPGPQRVDESRMATYDAATVATRAEYQVEAVARLRDELWPLLDAEDLQRVRQLEDDVIYPVCEMEKNGSPIDVELLEQFQRECTTIYGRMVMDFFDEIGFRFEHTTSHWTRLFEQLGLPPSDSYKEEIIAAIDHPVIQRAHLIAQYSSLNSKTFAAYAKQIGPDGILRYDINQLRGDDGGTVSGRFSIGYVQQVPNHGNHHRVFGRGDDDACAGLCPLFPRRLYRAADDFEYLEADASQIEYRIGAHHANNAEVIAAYTADPWISFHKMTWGMLKRYKADMLYGHTKNFNFAKQYGARSIKLATMMGFITEAEGIEIRAASRWDDPRLDQIHEIEAAYKKIMPEADQLLDRAAHLAKPACDNYCKPGDWLHRHYPHRGYVKTLLGRRRRFPNGWKVYIAFNHAIQGTGADIMKRKLVELHRARRYTGLLLRLTAHDAVGGDCQLPETKARVAEVLNAQSFPELKVPILWSVKTGRNWAECR